MNPFQLTRTFHRFSLETVVISILLFPAVTAAAPAANQPPPVPVLQIGHSAEVKAAAFSPDGKSILTAGWDDTGILWDAATGQERLALCGHMGWLFAVAFSPDSKTVVMAGFDGVWFWDATTGAQQGTLEPYPGVVRAVQFSPDGKTLAVGSDAYPPRLWDVKTHHLVKEFGTFGSGANAIAFTPNGKALVSGHTDGLVHIWDTETGDLKATLHGHAAPVQAAAFSPDASLLATTANDGTARIWDTATRLTRFVLPSSEGAIYTAAFSPDGQTLLTGGADASPHLWDAATGKARAPLQWWEQEPIAAVAFSPDGKTVVTAGGATANPGVVRAWDVRSRSVKWENRGRTEVVTCTAFSPDGKLLVTGSGTGARLWDTATWKLRSSLPGGDGWTQAVAFSPDGKTVAFGGWGGGIQLFDSETGKRKVAIGPVYGIGAIAFSPDGTLVAACGGNTIKVWAVEGGAPKVVMKTPNDIIQMLAVSSDNRVIAVSSMAHTQIWLMDMASGELKRTIDHKASMLSIAIAPNGKTLATGGWDGHARLWDIETGEARGVFPVNDGVRTIGFSADGKSLATGGMGGQLRAWNLLKPDDPPTIGPGAGLDYPPSLLHPLKTGSGALILLSPSTGRPILHLIPMPRARVTTSANAADNAPETRNASWFITTPDGFFDCSDDALKLLRWNSEGVVYPADHFAAQLHQPDVVEKALRGDQNKLAGG